MKVIFSPHACDNYNIRVNRDAVIESDKIYLVENYVHTFTDKYNKDSNRDLLYYVYTGQTQARHAFLMMNAKDVDTTFWPDHVRKLMSKDIMYCMTVIHENDNKFHHTAKCVREAYRIFNKMKK